MSIVEIHEAELENRIAAGWAAFHKHSKCILNKHVSLQKRLHYFDACVTPSVLFALAAFPLPQSKLNTIDRLQRRMLRRIIGWRRTDGEDWQITMSRMKHRMEAAMNQYSCEAWSVKLLKNHWRYAAHLISAPIWHWGKRMTKYTNTAILDPQS